MASGIRALCDYAKGKGVEIHLETHGDFNTIENLMPVVEKVKDCPEFGILWDIGNTDDTYGANWREIYNELKPYLKHLHIKDHVRKDGKTQYCLIGEGDIPIADIVATLQKDGYTGWYCLEWEKKWKPEIEEPEVAFPGYYEYMKKLLK